MCTIIVSGSVIGFHLVPSVTSSRTRTASCRFSSVMSTSMCRNVRGQAFDVDVAGQEVDHPTLQLDATRLTLEHDRHRDHDRLVHRQRVEIGVEQAVRHRVELVLLHHDARLGALDLQADERVGAAVRVQDAQQLLRIDRHGDTLRRLAIFLGAVQHRRDAAGRTQPVRLVLAAPFSLHRFKRRFHCSFPL
jgi:hypothetical protein